MLKQHDITVIVGVSGVGKSYFVRSLLNLSNDLIHFSAGTLIKKRLEKIDRDKLRLLSTSEVLQNQYVLVDQFNEELKTIEEGRRILFDAHMVIDTDKGLLEIPFDVFKKIKPSRFIFLQENPGVILERRLNDSSRDRPQRSEDQILKQQSLSIKLAREYAGKLSKPVVFTNANNTQLLEEFFDSHVV